MSGSEVLRVEGICKHFPGVKALSDVSFDLRAGEVHVLLGENGAGKSTLMKVLAGAYEPDSGQMFVGGQPVRLAGPKHAERLGIAIIYQEFNLVPYLSVAANIFLGREPGRGFVDYHTMHRRAREILSSLNVNIDTNALVQELGVAQRQMVEVAKALSLDARVLIMDEPTAALSLEEAEQLFATIRRLRGRGVSIVYISHRLEDLKEIGDRVTVMRNGAVVGSSALGEITIAEMIRLMAGREIDALFPRDFGASQVGEEALRVKGLSRKGVLHDIDLVVRRGEIVGLAGIVGAGRTELARAIYGVDRIDRGEIHLFGKRIAQPSPSLSVSMGVGLLPEDRKEQGLALEMNVKENIVMASLRKLFPSRLVSARRETEEAERLRQQLQIATPNLQRTIRFLSGGNQQKAVIARWLLRDCQLFIFDEPTRGIDVGAKAEVHRLMDDLVKQGAAVLLISSELPEVLHMSDRLYVMRNGRIAAELSREEASPEVVLGYATGGNRLQQDPVLTRSAQADNF